jgi:hypothetical protein
MLTNEQALANLYDITNNYTQEIDQTAHAINKFATFLQIWMAATQFGLSKDGQFLLKIAMTGKNIHLVFDKFNGNPTTIIEGDIHHINKTIREIPEKDILPTPPDGMELHVMFSLVEAVAKTKMGK